VHDPGGRRWQGVTGTLVMALALASLAAGCGSGGGKSASKTAAAGAQTIRFQKPEDPGPQPFTAASDVTGSKTVDLPASGPYGGSGSDKVCDRDLLISFLKRNPDRMRAWARVVGIDPDFKTVSRFIAKLHPVTLTRDTQVTNHSFVNGQATAFQSILQAGTAVLVDKYGHPVARCRCGNPLKEPVYFKSATCKYCPPHYEPPTQCKLYSGDTDYDKDSYSGDYYTNEEYDATFIDSSKSGPYSKCYEAYPDPPKVTTVTLYKPPAQTTTPSYETQTQPYNSQPYHGYDCNNPRSQYEYEQCHPSQHYPGTTTTEQPPYHEPPSQEPSYP
jgi:hypothetical protein